MSLVNAATGAAVAGFTTITGQNQPTGLALSGSTLYVLNTNNGGGGVSSTRSTPATGALLTSHFVMNLGNANYAAVSGSGLYVASYGNNAIYGFNATTAPEALAGFTTAERPEQHRTASPRTTATSTSPT